MKAVLIFFVSYVIFLVIWVQVKNYYSQGITFAASKIVAGIKGARLEEIIQKKDYIQATFSPLRQDEILIDIPVKTSSYTFNAPLTFAIMASLYLFITRRKRAYAEAVLILIGVHLLYVFSLEAKELTDVFIDRRIEAINKLHIFAYEFLWSFTDNMVIRFEPFLIGFYMFARFKTR